MPEDRPTWFTVSPAHTSQQSASRQAYAYELETPGVETRVVKADRTGSVQWWTVEARNVCEEAQAATLQGRP